VCVGLFVANPFVCVGLFVANPFVCVGLFVANPFVCVVFFVAKPSCASWLPRALSRAFEGRKLHAPAVCL
jgi:hypothetical protein